MFMFSLQFMAAAAYVNFLNWKDALSYANSPKSILELLRKGLGGGGSGSYRTTA